MDFGAWVDAGLVDRLMLGCWSGGPGRRGEPVDLSAWKQRASGTATRVLGAVDNAAESDEPTQLHEAAAVLRRIAAQTDGVYLFNTPPATLALLLDRARPAADPQP
jgi:hypothetical protein